MSDSEEVFLAVDQVLPIIELADPVEVEIRITAERVWLRIGQRDMGWDRKTGKQTDSGTMLGDGTDMGREGYGQRGRGGPDV